MKQKPTPALTGDGRLRLENGDLAFYEDAEAVEQELRVLLATIEGEDRIDPELGVDVFELAGEASPIIEREVIIALQQDDRVETVDRIDVDIDEEQRMAEISVAAEVQLDERTEIQFETEMTV